MLIDDNKMKQGNSCWNRDRNAIRGAVACVILKNMRSNFHMLGKLREKKNSTNKPFQVQQTRRGGGIEIESTHFSGENHAETLEFVTSCVLSKRQDQVMTLDSFQHALLCLNYACDSI